MIVVGVDPGEKGAIAMLGDATVAVWDTVATADFLKAIREHPMDIDLLVVEATHAFPKINATTNYKMGRGGGLWEGICRALLIPSQEVAASKWQRAICGALPKERPARKRAIADFAGRRWPTVELRGPRGAVLDGRSDALCIAEWGRCRLGDMLKADELVSKGENDEQCS